MDELLRFVGLPYEQLGVASPAQRETSAMATDVVWIARTCGNDQSRASTGTVRRITFHVEVYFVSEQHLDAPM